MCIAGRDIAAVLLVGTACAASTYAYAGGPQVMMYVTVPLDGRAHSHVFGLRLDKEAAIPDIRIINPASPLNRRALLDLQMGGDSALRLELDRRLTWDFNQQQWRQSSLPATFNLRVPTRPAPGTHETPEKQLATAAQLASSASPMGYSSLSAALANPFQNHPWKQLVKSPAIEP